MTTREEFILLIANHREAATASVEGPENLSPWAQRPIKEASAALLAAFDAQQAKIDALTKALEYYADEKNWENDAVDLGVCSQPIPETSAVCNDGGERARAALESVK